MTLVNDFPPLYNVTGNSVLVAAGVLDLPLYFVIIAIIIITTIINIIFTTFIITRIFEQEQFTFLMRYVDRLVLFPLISLCVLITRPPSGVDALSRYCHLASFNYSDMKVRDICRFVDVI